jgi:hypothetical protein
MLSKFSTPGFLAFIQDAYGQCRGLFRDDASNVDDPSEDPPELYAEVSIVFRAWQRLQWMRKSNEKWSEADYAANV